MALRKKKETSKKNLSPCCNHEKPKVDMKSIIMSEIKIKK